MTTIRCNSTSDSATVIVLEHATKPFPAFDPASDDSSIIDWLDQLIAESLMISLAVAMLDVFTHGILQ